MEGVAAGAVEAVAIAEIAGRKPPRLRMLARRLGVPRAMLEQAMGPLVRARLISFVGRDSQPRVTLVRGAANTRIDEVLEAIRGSDAPRSRLAEREDSPTTESLQDLVLGKRRL